MAEITFYPFNSCDLLLDQSLLTVARGCGRRVTATVTWSVVVHPEGIVVIDTGIGSLATEAEDSDAGPDRVAIPVQRPGQELTIQLERLGLGPGDVRYVVNTHLHGDHVGANRSLPDATFVCQRDEYDYAQAPDIPSMIADYPPHDIAWDSLSYELLEADLDLFGDGRVQLLTTPGHTPGHQSVLLRLPDTGPVIVTGDAIWTNALLDETALPGVVWFPSVYVKSRRRLTALCEVEKARWFFSHDPDTFTRLGWIEGEPYR